MHSVFFTGSAGTGKSFVLQEIVRTLPADVTFPTSTTGITAAALGGGVADSLPHAFRYSHMFRLMLLARLHAVQLGRRQQPAGRCGFHGGAHSAQPRWVRCHS